jgi:hypothetical protein
MRAAECLMPASGLAPEEHFTDYASTPPEGTARVARHVYILCADLVRSTEDHDW